MEVVVGSRTLIADVAIALDVTGAEHLVVVAKATWQIPSSGQRPRPLEPVPLAYADEFFGSAEDSAMRYGADFARFKPACDVVFDAHAHAPARKAETELVVAWQVGSLRKALRVVGQRVWKKRLGRLTLSEPAAFTTMPLHYGLAFGGTRTFERGRGDQRQTLTESMFSNPIGQGWTGPRTAGAMEEGALAPCLESHGEPNLRSPQDRRTPAAFSAIARHWEPRKQFAGTYDETWERDVFPLLPADFDERFHQCAPPDQQMSYPLGGEQVILRNMMGEQPYVKFSLPRLDALAMRVLRRDYTAQTLHPVVDTLFFEPEARRFSAVWRASTRLRRGIQEVETVTVGPVEPAWWEARKLGLQGGCFDCGSSEVRKETLA